MCLSGFVDLVLLIWVLKLWLCLVLIWLGGVGFGLLDGLIGSCFVCDWLVLIGLVLLLYLWLFCGLFECLVGVVDLLFVLIVYCWLSLMVVVIY